MFNQWPKRPGGTYKIFFQKMEDVIQADEAVEERYGGRYVFGLVSWSRELPPLIIALRWQPDI
jgi:hypothetical protein